MNIWEMDKCPVTGLPITRKPEWSNKVVGGYRVTISVIGDDIIHVKSWGVSDVKAAMGAIQLREQVLRDTAPPDGRYFLVEDYTEHENTSHAAKKYNIDYHKNNNQLKGMYFFGTGLKFSLMINIAKKLHKPAFPVEIVPDYQAALQCAAHEALCTEQFAAGSNLFTNESWSLELDGITCRYRLVEVDVLHYAAEGNLREHHVPELFRLYERVLCESGLADKVFHYQIADWGGLSGGSWRARKLFVDRFNASHKRYPVRKYVVFGVNAFLKTVIRLSSQFMKIDMQVANDYQSGLELIRQEQTANPGRGKQKKPLPSLHDNPHGQGLQKSVDNLLNYMGGINWDQEGCTEDWKEGAQANSLQPIYDALSLIKHDFDEILREKVDAEQKLAEQNSLNSLRADILKLALDEYKSTENLIQGMLNRVGSFLEVNWAGFYHLKQKEGASSDWSCRCEYRRQEVASKLFERFPQAVFPLLSNSKIRTLTLESALEQVREPDQAVMRDFFRTSDLLSITLVPFIIHNKVSGFFSFEVRGKSGDPKFPTKQQRGVIREMVRIVSDNVLRKQVYSLQKAKEAAEAASKTKSDFLVNLSHELRTPMNSILGFSQVLMSRQFGSLNEKQCEYLGDILESGDHLLNLIKDILDMSKIETGKNELQLATVKTGSLLETGLRMIREKCNKHGINLSLDVAGTVREQDIVVDERKLNQVLINLLANAAKFTPDGGAITLLSRMEEERIFFKVKDSGIGIPGEHLPNVHKKFYQVQSASAGKPSGTGLGLSIAKKLVEMHGGEISIESGGEGKGCAVEFWVPIAGCGA